MFKIGDKVVYIGPTLTIQGDSNRKSGILTKGDVGIIWGFAVEAEGNQPRVNYKHIGKVLGMYNHHFVLEEVYNSPLYQALQEEEL